MNSFDKAQLNQDYALPVVNMLTNLEQEAIENEANQIYSNEYDDLVLYITENGNADIYDKHFKAMMNGEDKAKENAKAFMFEQALKMAKERFDKLKNNDALY